jgi:hypothetical protein
VATITIDGKEYEFEQFSKEIQGQILSMRAADARIAELKRDLAFVQTARNSYGRALKELMAKESIASMGDTIKFS